MMKKGDQGTLVIWLQDALGITTDGDFGSKTETAVKEFQEANNLEVDGEAGGITLQTLGLDFSPFYINGTSKSVEWLLPVKGKGFRTYNRDGNDQFGTIGTIGTLMDVCEAWESPDDVDAQIGNISRRRGGTHNPHKSHKNGNQVDVRPFRNDGKYTELTYTHPAYSQKLTENFIRLILNRVKGATVLFNDPELVAKKICKKHPGHDNHLHINFPSINYHLEKWQIDMMIADSPRKMQKPKMKIPAISQVFKVPEKIEETGEAEQSRAEEPAAQSQPQTQIAEQITNIEAEKSVPDNFVAEMKTQEAPPKENSVENANKMTILGFTVPAFLVAIFTAIKNAVAEGYINVSDVLAKLTSFILEHTHYLFWLIGLVIILLIVKKLVKQITLWISMFINANPNWHNIEVTPSSQNTEVRGKWWQLWK